VHPAEELARHSGPVRFERIDVWRVRIPMREPFRISSGEVSLKDAILVRVAEGSAFGWGESSAMAGAFYSTETPDTCEEELVEQILPVLSGRPFVNLGALEAEVARLTGSRFVRVAVETAAWELAARKRGVALRQLFGIPNREVPSGLAIGLYNEFEELRQSIERYRFRDYHRLKVKIKRGQDVELVARVREWVRDFPLFVDANADYGLEDIGVFERLERYRLMMYEQPMAKCDFAGSGCLQKRVATPVCLDETIESAEDVRRAAEAGSCRIVNIKLQRVGGFLEAIRVMEECAVHGIPVWMGTMPELGVGSAQALVLAAHPACAFPTDLEPSDRWYTDDLLEEGLHLYQRNLHVPEGPGLGFRIDMAKVEGYATSHWTF
jgi:O-succinylbenzoate synthase